MEGLFWPAGDWRWGIAALCGIIFAFLPEMYDRIRSWRSSREERERMKNTMIWLRMDFLQNQINVLQMLKRDVVEFPSDEEEDEAPDA